MLLMSRHGRHGVSYRSRLDSFRRRLEGPGDHECDRKSDRDQRDDQSYDPVRDFQERKDLRRHLNCQPRHDRVRNRHLVNIAPLQLGEEAL